MNNERRQNVIAANSLPNLVYLREKKKIARFRKGNGKGLSDTNPDGFFEKGQEQIRKYLRRPGQTSGHKFCHQI